MKQAGLKIVFAVFTIVLFSYQGSAQKSDFHWKQLNSSSNRLKGKLTGTVYTLSLKSNANYFLQNNWIEGSITLEDNDVFDSLMLRYNAFEDLLVVYNNTLRTMFIADKEKVKSFTFSEGNQKFARYFYNGYPKGYRYFEVLYEGNRDFLAFREIIEEKTKPYHGYFGNMMDVQYVKRYSYYMYSPETGFRKIKLRRRSVLNVFPENKKEIRRLLRKNKVNILEESDMIRAFELLDTNGYFQ